MPETAQSEWSDKIVDYAGDRSHCYPLAEPTHTAEAVNPACGDRASVALVIVAGQIEQISINVAGCCLSRAAGAILAEECHGLPHGYAKMLTDAEIVAMVGIDPASPRRGCVLLPLIALRKAVKEGQRASVEASR